MEKIEKKTKALIVFLCWVACVVFPYSSLAQETSTPTPFTGSSNQTPDRALSFQTDLFTGHFTYKIPIVLPPARQNSQPNIVVGYNSTTPNNWCGAGWTLDMGYIQRDLRGGIPIKWSGSSPLTQYDDAKGFTVSFQGVNARLVNISGNEYRAEVDGGTFLKFTYVNPNWAVTDKSGTKYYFGETSASRMENTKFPAGPGNSTFRWALSSVQDANGNTTSLTYIKDNNQLYLSQVAYNANAGSSPALPETHTVNFNLEDRTDINVSFQPGYRVATAKRLKEIVVHIGSSNVRRYKLDYINSPCTYRSILNTVTEYGADDVTSLPPLKFTYQNKPFQFDVLTDWGPLDSQGYAGSDWNSIFADANGYTYVGLYDINGDGLPDRVMERADTPHDRFKVQLNTGSGFAPATDWSPVDGQGLRGTDWNGIAAFVSSHGRYVGFQDINGDGLPDRVMENAPGPYNKFKVQLNNGLGFSSLIDWGPIDGQGSDSAPWSSQHAVDIGSGGGALQYAGLYDINGDGLADRIMMIRNSGGGPNLYANYFVVQLNTGSGFGPLINWTTVDEQGSNGWNAISGDDGGTYTYVGLYDINGDGLPDRVMTKNSSTRDAFVVQLNNGAGFEPVENWGPLNSQGITDVFWNSPAAYQNGMDQVGLYDINGDGLLDRVMRKAYTPYDRFEVQLNTGSGFGPLVEWTGLDSQGITDAFWNSPASYSNGMIQVGLYDINGDGLPDRVMRKAYAPYDRFKVQLNKGPFPDLLSTVDNGLGGKVAVAYTSSTTYDNRDQNGRNWLPFSVQTVSSISVDDGMGNVNTTTYSYKGGMYEPTTKEFRGFNKVTVTDPLGTKTVTYFHQGGGIDDSSNGEFQDQTAKAKQGIPYRVEVWGNDGLLYSQSLNKVEEIQLDANGWYFPYVSQTIAMEYEGLSNYRAVAKQFTFDTTTLNLIKESNLGEIAYVNPAGHTFYDIGTNDNVYTYTAYAALTNPDIKNKPASIKVTSDSAGAYKLRETLFTIYDQSRGNLKEAKSWLDTNGGYAVTTIDYDQYGNPVSSTDPVGITTTTTYDAAYKTFPITQTTATFISQFVVDARSGQVTQTTDPKGLVSETTYDTFFRPTQTAISTTPNGPATLWREKISYNLGGITGGISYNYVRKQVYDPLDTANGIEGYIYSDGLGRTIQTRSEAETAGQFRAVDAFYNERGQPKIQTIPIFSAGEGFTTRDPAQPGTSTEYDPIGRAFRVTPPTGDNGSPTGPAETAFKDGADPWVTVTIDPEGKIRRSFNDSYGRVIRIVEVNAGANYTTYLGYDKLGNLTGITDDAGNTTTMAYDSLGRKTSMTDPDMGTWTYKYDNADRLTEQKDAKNQKIKFFYVDSIGRMSKREIWNASNVKVATITYTYDVTDDAALPVFKGQLAKIVDRSGWQKYGYDVRDRAIGSKRYVSAVGQSPFTRTTYDDADRVTELWYPAGIVTKVKYTYDTGGNLSRVESLSGTGGSVVFYTAQGFDALGQPTGVTYGNGLQTTYNYYANSKRLERMQTTKPSGGYHQDLSYAYDTVSNIKSITDGVYTGMSSSTTTNIQYDDLYRLTSYARGATTYNFSYNPIGNVLVNPEFGAGAYSYGAKPHAVTSANGKTYIYDACGNMTKRGATTLSYNEENQLKQYGSSVSFGYDYSGQRLWKKSGTVYTVWIGGIYELKNGKTLCHVIADGKRIATFEPGGAGIFYYYADDHLGSSNILMDRAGNMVQHYEYTGFGKEQLKDNASAFSVSNRYTDQVLDEDTGLYYYNARYYDPELARFIQPDSIVPDGGDPQAFNRYSYVNNNPLNFVDPSGQYYDTTAYLSLTTSGNSYSSYDFFSGSASSSSYSFSASSYSFSSFAFSSFNSSSYKAAAPPVDTSSVGSLWSNIARAYTGPDTLKMMAQGFYSTLNNSVLFGMGPSSGNQDADLVGSVAGFITPTPGGKARAAVKTVRAVEKGMEVVKAKKAISAAKGGMQFTKSSLSFGREMHAGYKLAEHAPELGRFKEFTGIKGIRPDFVDFATKTISELKPFNPRGMQSGMKQLERYKALFEEKYGGIWKTVLDTY